MRSIIIKFSALLLAGELFSWWLLFYSTFDIPLHIHGTPINISGLLLIILHILIIYFFQKKVLKFNRQTTVIQLTFLGGFVSFISEFVFQSIQFNTIIADTFAGKLYYACRAVIVIPIFAIFISFIIGIFLKRKAKSASKDIII